MIAFRKSLLVSIVLLVSGLGSAGPAVAENGGPRMSWPTTGRITQPYGCTGFKWEPKYGSCRHFHGGIDIANRRGTPIRAAEDGWIARVGWDQWGTGAWMVIIKHGGGFTTWYAHMRGKHIDGIRKGARVRQGQLIGYMDTTGMSTGSHLHWAVLKNGRYVNPRNFVTGLPRRGNANDGASGSAVSCDAAVTAYEPGAETAYVLRDDGGGGASEACLA